MQTPTAEFELLPRKRPVQARSRRTFQEIVSGAEGLLRTNGYYGTTTNHIAAKAEVNIATLYEYFPGKDAIVAQVADGMVDRMVSELGDAAEEALAAGHEIAIRTWVRSIYEVARSERDLLEVLFREVPFAREIPAIQSASNRLLELALNIWDGAGEMVHPDFNEHTLRLAMNLVNSTVYQLSIDPPPDETVEAVLDELTHRLETWIRKPR